MTTPTRLRSIRRAKGFTARRLAEEVGISRPHVVRLEAGQCLPNVVTALRIAEALGVDVTEIWAPESVALSERKAS